MAHPPDKPEFLPPERLVQLAEAIKRWGRELGFGDIGISDTELDTHEQHLLDWIDQGCHGEMAWMETHGTKRSRPADLVPGTQRVICARMDYLAPGTSAREQPESGSSSAGSTHAMVSRYARGRDYHKVLRQRLQKLAHRIELEIGPFGYRVFTDSAPVLEKALAEKAGLGWIGKHSNLLHREAGSWFFLGEIYTDLPLPVDNAASNHCGECVRCIEACPTGAITAPYRVDGRRCISYLTIELRGSIPEDLRPLMGNRVFGCDDCQAVCPWNRFADFSDERDFQPRHGLDDVQLAELFAWTQAEFEEKTAGSAIRRAGYEGWLRNIAIGLGNADTSPQVVQALKRRSDDASPLVREHVQWALAQHENRP